MASSTSGSCHLLKSLCQHPIMRMTTQAVVTTQSTMKTDLPIHSVLSLSLGTGHEGVALEKGEDLLELA
jgi:hypothetical protein